MTQAKVYNLYYIKYQKWKQMFESDGGTYQVGNNKPKNIMFSHH
jgi:hypothetical protein